MNNKSETWSNRELGADITWYWLEVGIGILLAPFFVATLCVLSNNATNPEYWSGITNNAENWAQFATLISPLLLTDGVRRLNRNIGHWRMYSQDQNN